VKVALRVLFSMKNKILLIETILISSIIVLIIFLEYAKRVLGWDNFWFYAAGNILIALASGLSIGIIFELFVRKAQRDETFEIAKLSKELERSGFEQYQPEFKDFSNEFKELLKKSLEIDMYLTYGKTIFNLISPELLDAFKRKNCRINIFIIGEENPFLRSIANLWSRIGEEYNEDGLRRKIQETSELLIRLANTALVDKYHADIKIFKLQYNPINFSFYRFDDYLLFCPTKLTERKEYRAMTIVCRKANSNDIFHWVLDELNHIKNQPDSIIKIFPK
jgi:hypothetical protein